MISNSILEAKKIVESEQIIGLPTETVYGLAGSAFSEKAIRSIFQLKKRPLNNPLIVHIGKIDQLAAITSEFPSKARMLAEQFWPGPLTLLLKKSKRISDLVTAGQEIVAVRIPNHPKALELLNQLDFPLVAPSANPYQSISPTSAQHVERYFGNELKLILDGGPSTNGLESTIVGFDGDKVVVYRLGALTIEEIEACIGKVEIQHSTKKDVKSPGMAKKHYSPKTPVIVTDSVQEIIAQYETKKIAVVCFDQLPKINKLENCILYSFQGDMKKAASRLYALLHELDLQNLDLIILEEFPNSGLGKTINDRIKRASATK
jgi:L-threonylcarbamoyladenylate synthase